MLDELATLHGLRPPGVCAEVRLDQLDVLRAGIMLCQHAPNFIGALHRTQCAANAVALCQKLQDEMLGDEARCAGDQNARHAVLPC